MTAGYRRAVTSALALAFAFFVTLFFLSFPPVFAGLCPRCFGFVPAGDNIFIEPNAGVAPAQVRADVRAAVAAIEPVVGAAYVPARVLVCFTEGCNGLMGGTSTIGMTYGTRLIYLPPQGYRPEIMRHELVHAVLHQKVGLRRSFSIPAWVDEGLAVYVSADPRVDLDPATCRFEAADLVESKAELRRLGPVKGPQAYGAAGCALAHLVAQNGPLVIAQILAGVYPSKPRRP
ncbi:hypothetical protein AQS8620_00901 [Aquimixticola soesokkakensis]|uniref:Uncharacterized protein n=1 Tax=Aquimixticola soesokkakensis TaxID=1519096 RepID=A0A1Y5S1U3_9RHOB|nr:hypothetical protein [Aquimixticola soesokkakensis]SLN29335.1 hypothetical protein AQS8620_00901 [Aquimixticola soesokkakensis]